MCLQVLYSMIAIHSICVLYDTYYNIQYILYMCMYCVSVYICAMMESLVYVCMYSEYSLIRRNSFGRNFVRLMIWWIILIFRMSLPFVAQFVCSICFFEKRSVFLMLLSDSSFCNRKSTSSASLSSQF